MRIFTNFPDARGEIARDLKEMGIRYQAETMQDKDVHDNPDFQVLELLNYQYQLSNINLMEMLPMIDSQWCEAEFTERMSPEWFLNPGNAWKLREEIWTPFLEESGEFSYTYHHRMHSQVALIIDELGSHPHSRQLFLGIWDLKEDPIRRGERRVPCSLGYWFVRRGLDLHVSYLQRSADFSEHFNNDVYLACKLLEHIAREADLNVGTFTHWLGSLHVFEKDVEGVF